MNVSGYYVFVPDERWSDEAKHNLWSSWGKFGNNTSNIWPGDGRVILHGARNINKQTQQHEEKTFEPSLQGLQPLSCTL